MDTVAFGDGGDGLGDDWPIGPDGAGASLAKIAPDMGSDQILVLNLSGRGDKDISIAAEAMGIGL